MYKQILRCMCTQSKRIAYHFLLVGWEDAPSLFPAKSKLSCKTTHAHLPFLRVAVARLNGDSLAQTVDESLSCLTTQCQISRFLSHSHTHTYTYTCIHTYTHTHIHTFMHTHTHTYTHTHTFPPSFSLTLYIYIYVYVSLDQRETTHPDRAIEGHFLHLAHVVKTPNHNLYNKTAWAYEHRRPKRNLERRCFMQSRRASSLPFRHRRSWQQSHHGGRLICRWS